MTDKKKADEKRIRQLAKLLDEMLGLLREDTQSEWIASRTFEGILQQRRLELVGDEQNKTVEEEEYRLLQEQTDPLRVALEQVEVEGRTIPTALSRLERLKALKETVFRAVREIDPAPANRNTGDSKEV